VLLPPDLERSLQERALIANREKETISKFWTAQFSGCQSIFRFAQPDR
jgi:hypothetical protein